MEKELQNIKDKLVLERRKRMKLEDKLMRVKTMIKMYSAIDKEVANTIVESVDETLEEVNK